MVNNKTLGIVIPVLNEETTLVENINKVLEYLNSEALRDTKVIFYIGDNGSTDQTPQLSQELVTKYPGIVYYEKVPQKGVGRALKHTWPLINADYVGYMDLDIATDLKHIKEVVDAFEKHNADLVYGTRLHKKSVVVGRSPKREFTSRAFNFILRAYLGVKVSDGMCGFKFLRKDILHDLIMNGVDNNGWFFSTELLTIAEWKGYTLYELPVKWTDDSNSKVNIQRLAIQYLKGMKRLRGLKKAICKKN